jgi:hypothetical protein
LQYLFHKVHSAQPLRPLRLRGLRTSFTAEAQRTQS